MNKHCVYVHQRPVDGSVFYVGKGTLKRANYRWDRSEHWHRTVNKHGLVVKVIADNLTEQAAFDMEMELIAFLRQEGVDLINKTDGGEGASGFKQSEETKQKKNAKLRGRRNSEATIARMRAAHAGKVIDPAARARIANTLRGRYAGSKNPNARAIQCIETGEQFETMVDAAKWLQSMGHVKASFKSVSSAVSGAKLTAYGYHWKAA